MMQKGKKKKTISKNMATTAAINFQSNFVVHNGQIVEIKCCHNCQRWAESDLRMCR